MTANEIEIVSALSKAYIFRPTKSADFIDRLAAKEHPEAYELTEGQRIWLMSLLHRYRAQLKALHFQHCTDKECRAKMDGEVKRRKSQLCLF
jgi:hypothetical protein